MHVYVLSWAEEILEHAVDVFASIEAAKRKWPGEWEDWDDSKGYCMVIITRHAGNYTYKEKYILAKMEVQE